MPSNASSEPAMLVNLYRAAIEPELWPLFLEQLATLTGASSAALVMLKEGDESFAVSQSWNLDPAATKIYGEHFAAHDVWAHRGLKKPTGFVCVSEELCPMPELSKTEIFNDFLLHSDIVHGLFAVAHSSASAWASLSLYRGGQANSFQKSELDVIDAVVPHLQNAFKLHFRFADMKSRGDSLEEALGMLGTGVIFLGRKGEILASNQTADRILAEQDGLAACASGLRCTHPPSADLLAKLIADSAETSEGRGTGPGGTLSIPRKDRPPLQVRVAPVAIQQKESARSPAAVVFITCHLAEAKRPEKNLRELFGLTPAESRVALLLTRGECVNKIAELIGVSRNTVRSQMKSIYAKTQVNRQSDLVRLLLNPHNTTISNF
jgi:DNA-binding CsgD family transcriptional regulator